MQFRPGPEAESFRGEVRQFLDRAWRPCEHDQAEVVEAQFVELPARPMVDIKLPQGIHRDDLGSVLRRATAQLPGDAVVRITYDGSPAPALVRSLSAAFLRSCFPASMNVQLSRELIDASR